MKRPCTTLVVSTLSPASNHFRVGSREHGYIYTVMEGFEHANFPIYQCRRGRYDNVGFLHLYCDADTWTAMEIVGPLVVAGDIVGRGTPAFRAAIPCEDVRQHGLHTWQCYDNTTTTWSAPSSFMTTTLGAADIE